MSRFCDLSVVVLFDVILNLLAPKSLDHPTGNSLGGGLFSPPDPLSAWGRILNATAAVLSVPNPELYHCDRDFVELSTEFDVDSATSSTPPTPNFPLMRRQFFVPSAN